MPKKPHNYSKKGSQSLNKHTYSLTMQLKTERQSTKSIMQQQVEGKN
jgi:hypothetical protein